MAWPVYRFVECKGFDRSLLPIIRRACDGGMIEWGPKASVVLNSASNTFTWAGCTWLMEEFNEWVERITLLDGIPDSIDLTAALLKG